MTYYWQVRAIVLDRTDTSLWSSTSEFQMVRRPPALSNITAGDITSFSAGISWDSDEPATSQVDYGTSTSYGLSTTLDTALVSSHAQILSDLQPSTTYHYRVRSPMKPETRPSPTTSPSAPQTARLTAPGSSPWARPLRSAEHIRDTPK